MWRCPANSARFVFELLKDRDGVTPKTCLRGSLKGLGDGRDEVIGGLVVPDDSSTTVTATRGHVARRQAEAALASRRC